jgi:hypothetical protein
MIRLISPTKDPLNNISQTYCSPENSPNKLRKPLGFSKMRLENCCDSPDKTQKFDSPVSSPCKSIKKIQASPEKYGMPQLLLINDD